MTAIQLWLIGWVDEGFSRKPWRNQAWLAQRVGISQKHLSQMLTGRVAGSFEVWEKLLAELEVLDEALAALVALT